MSNSCVNIPDASNGKPSNLFMELRAKTKNRELTKTIWGFTQTELFKSEFSDLPKDENGEITYSAVAEVLQLDELFSREEADINLAIDSGIASKSGKDISFQSPSLAIQKAESYNEKASTKVAVVEEDGKGGFVVSIKDKTAQNLHDSITQSVHRNLNDRLIDMLHKAGYDIRFTDDPGYNGIFNPLLADKNALGLKTVIEVANNRKGREAIPEEICHAILAGLKSDPLKQRLDSVFTDQIVQRVLGERYKEYYEKYKNGKTPIDERLRDEAEGQALAAMLKGETEFFDRFREESETEKVARENRNLLQRIWDKAKSMFRKLSPEDVDAAIDAAKASLSPIADAMLDDSIIEKLNHEDIMNHEFLNDLASRTAAALNKAEEGQKLLSKRLYLLQHSHFNDVDASDLSKKIDKVREEISNANYYSACWNILDAIGKEVQALILDTNAMGHVYSPASNLEQIAANAGLVSRLSDTIDGYMPYLLTLQELPQLVKNGEIEFTDTGAKILSDAATQYIASLAKLKAESRKMRRNVLKQLISLYYGINGNKPENFTESDKVKWQSVDMILDGAEKDISFWDTGIFSAGDSLNPLINIVHHIVTKQQAKRNNIIQTYIAKMQAAEVKLHKASHDSKFIYQYDENGNPTGYYVAPVDMMKYEKDETAMLDDINTRLSNGEIDFFDAQEEKKDWYDSHLIDVEVGEPIGLNGERRVERLPDPEIYGTPDFQEGWDDAQKEYYKTVLDLKAEMDSILPMPMQSLYRAPQVRKSVSQMFDKDGPGALQTMWKRWKQDWSVTSENLEYGATVVTDFRNRELKRVPIYFTGMLDDRKDVSTDAAHAMSCYITMAVNYSEMGKLANAMRLLQDYVEEDGNYKVKVTKGGRIVQSVIQARGAEQRDDYYISGSKTKTVRQLTRFVDRTVFNQTKNPLPVWQITDKFAIDWNSVFNIFMRTTSVARMGINVLSAITNVSQGKSQMITEAFAKRFFNMDDMLKADGEYFKLLFDYLGQFNKLDRHDKMYMLINTFNSSEDFFRDMRDRNFNKSPFKRVLGRGNIYFLNSAGEHYLHTAGMLSILNHEKVIRVGDPERKEVSLYDVIKQVEDENGWHLELDSDIEFVDKNRAFLQDAELAGKDIIKKDEDRDALFENLSLYINNINASLHGGYSEAERGNENQLALVRLILQFRQWMMGMYNRLYSGSYYDATLKMQREGGYVSILKFIVGTIHDRKAMGIKMAIENNRLTQQEKENARVAWAQSGLVVVLGLLTAFTGGLPDEDDRAKRLLAYSLKRLQLETGALAIAPYPHLFVKNIFTLVQSPAAGVQTLQSLSELLDFTSAWSEINSGRFKGWSRFESKLFKLTPLYNVQKLIDMRDYDYMFNIFN